MDAKPHGTGWRGFTHGLPRDTSVVRKLVARVSDAQADDLLTKVFGSTWAEIRDEEDSHPDQKKSAAEVFGDLLRPKDLRR